MNDDRYLEDLNIPPTNTTQQRQAGINTCALVKKQMKKAKEPQLIKELGLILEALGIKDYESGKRVS